MYLSYRSLSRNELFLYHGNALYIYIDENTFTQDVWGIMGGLLGSTVLLVLIVLEHAFGMEHYRVYVAVYLRNIACVTSAVIACTLPYFLEILVEKFGIGSSMCTYSNSEFEKVRRSNSLIYLGKKPVRLGSYRVLLDELLCDKQIGGHSFERRKTDPCFIAFSLLSRSFRLQKSFG